MLWRSQLRRHWRSWVLLTVLLAIGAGTAMACVAGARRAASAFDRFAVATEFPDVNSGHGRPPADAVAAVAGLDGVASHSTVVGFVGFVEDQDAAAIKYFIASWDEPVGRSEPVLRAGRLPAEGRVDEVLVIGRGAQVAGLQPGDAVTVQLFTSDFSSTVAHDVTVVGIGDDPLGAVADATYDRTAMYFTPAFARANARDQQAWSATEAIADPATGEEDLIEQVREIGWTIDETRTNAQTRVQDAIRPLVAVLALLGALTLVTTLIVVGQALARRSEAADTERETVRSMGATARQLRALDTAVVLAVAVPGSLAGMALAVALSPLFPTGAVGRLDPDSGAFADWTVLALGAAAVVVALTALGGSRSRRPKTNSARPLPSRLAALRPDAASGVRLAVGGTTRERFEFWRSVALTAGGLCLLVGGLAFVASLAALKDQPRHYGAAWDLTTRNAFGDVPPADVVALTEGDDDIEGLAGGTLSGVVVEGMDVPLMAFLPITAELWPTVTAGDIPQGENEVLVGAEVLADLDAEIGDEITLRTARSGSGLGGGGSSPSGGPSGPAPDVTVKVVGTAVFPSIELAGLDPARLGQGIAMRWSDYRALMASSGSDDPAPDMMFFDLADGVDPASVIARYPEGMPEASFGAATEWLTSLAPAEVIETDRATGLIWIVVALLAVVVAASLVHGLIGAIREHRRDYATLKAIGFTRGQITGSITWQSMTPIVLSVVLALPFGTALGRWWWRLLAGTIGVVDSAAVPVTALAVITALAVVAAALIALGPGLRAARTPAAALLRDE
jgi:hypothetical protein